MRFDPRPWQSLCFNVRFRLLDPVWRPPRDLRSREIQRRFHSWLLMPPYNVSPLGCCSITTSRGSSLIFVDAYKVYQPTKLSDAVFHAISDPGVDAALSQAAKT